jgi:methionyl-tRNA formyltransferase
MRIIVFCGSTIALPSLYQLWEKNNLSALIYAQVGEPEWWLPLESWAADCGLPCWPVEEHSLENELSELIHEIRPELLLTYDFPYTLPGYLTQQVRWGAWNVQLALQAEDQGYVTIQRLDKANGEPGLQQVVRLLPAEESGSALHQLNLLSLNLLQAFIRAAANMPGKGPRFL